MSIVYRTVVGSLDRFVPTRLRPLWEHPTGPKTIFFWAPVMKWVSVDESETFELLFNTCESHLESRHCGHCRYCASGGEDLNWTD